jgi:FkbM family methyltransferase
LSITLKPMRRKFSNWFNRVVRVLDSRTRARVEMTYQVGGLEIYLPLNHALPDYQSRFRLYDKFLPHLASNLDAAGVIVDIGANVGDTAVVLSQYCSNHILCIEPDEEYFGFLERNIHNMDLDSRVTLSKSAIGEKGVSVLLEKSAGTARPIESNDGSGVGLVSLGSVLRKAELYDRDISLIKVDTDGLDYSILDNSIPILKEKKPIVYWENTVESQGQLISSNNTINRLAAIGYTNFACFDNFGSLMSGRCDAEVLGEINEYLLFQAKAGQVAVFYVDIMAWCSTDQDRAGVALRRFREFAGSNERWPRKPQILPEEQGA